MVKVKPIRVFKVKPILYILRVVFFGTLDLHDYKAKEGVLYTIKKPLERGKALSNLKIVSSYHVDNIEFREEIVIQNYKNWKNENGSLFQGFFWFCFDNCNDAP